MPSAITVFGSKSPLVAEAYVIFNDNDTVIVSGLTSTNGKINVFAWTQIKEHDRTRLVFLSKQKKVIFACLGMDGTRKGIIDEEIGRVRFVS